MRAEDILYFWFVESAPDDWWTKSKTFDDLIKLRFLKTYEQAAACELSRWRDTPRGRLAEIIVLDQFPRNMFRDSPRAFKADSLALGLAQEAVRVCADEQLNATERQFLYMPYMHSESLAVHAQALKLFSEPGLEGNYDFELKHMEIIKRFGRYPHRNRVLGRQSTAEELRFLSEPGSSF